MKRVGLLTILVIIILLVIGGAGFVSAKNNNGHPFGIGSTIVKDSGANISNYSAVFLTNGQVYFGKVVQNTSDETVLEDIYYLQVNQQQVQSGSTADNSQQPKIQLIKLGSELHGPNDRMRINRQQVLFTESMKNDSKVVDAINTDKAAKK